MRSLVVVVVCPWLEVLVSFDGVGPVFCVGPFSEGGLNKAFSLSVGSWRVGSGAMVLDGHSLACLTELF